MSTKAPKAVTLVTMPGSFMPGWRSSIFSTPSAKLKASPFGPRAIHAGSSSEYGTNAAAPAEDAWLAPNSEYVFGHDAAKSPGSAIEVEFKRHKALHSEFSVVFFDLDHFKKINDSFGHLFGDTVRYELLCRTHYRSGDLGD